MKHASTKGVTLIEMLIAVSLLAILTTGILMALRVGLNSLEKTNKRLMANRRSVTVQQILHSQFAGFMAEPAECIPDINQVSQRIPFFNGEPNSLRFISSYSLNEAARGVPHILEFLVIPGASGRGVRLVVNELLYTGPQSAGASCLGVAPDPQTGLMAPRFAPVQAGANSFVLADKLAYCRFTYERKLPPPDVAAWFPRWIFNEWPLAVRIEMAPLDPDPSGVPLVSATLPIRVNRQININYAD